MGPHGFQGAATKSVPIYSLLGSLIQGRLIGLIKNVDNFNGHEALRQRASTRLCT